MKRFQIVEQQLNLSLLGSRVHYRKNQTFRINRRNRSYVFCVLCACYIGGGFSLSEVDASGAVW